MSEDTSAARPVTLVFRDGQWACWGCGSPASDLPDLPQAAYDAGSVHIVWPLMHERGCVIGPSHLTRDAAGEVWPGDDRPGHERGVSG